jgi:membrane-associated phospholipid phosphatase
MSPGFRPGALRDYLRRLPGSAITAMVAAYVLAVSLFMIWRDISVSPEYVVGLFLLAALALGRTRMFLADWVPFLLLFLGYEFLRGFAHQTGIPVHYSDVIALEQLVAGGHVPTVELQHAFFHGPPAAWYDYLATLTYFLHFVYPLLLGYLFWLHRRSLFLRFRAALLLMSYAAFVVYVVLPVAPPWLASERGLLPQVTRINEFTLGSSISFIYHVMTSNPVAAMPSLHAAFPFLGFLFAQRLLGWRAWPLFVYTVTVWLAVVYLGEHYVVDVVGGALWAFFFYWVVNFAWDRRITPSRSSS